MPSTMLWREAGIASVLAAPLFLLASPFFIAEAHAEQDLHALDAKAEARLKKAKLMENVPHLPFPHLPPLPTPEAI